VSGPAAGGGPVTGAECIDTGGDELAAGEDRIRRCARIDRQPVSMSCRPVRVLLGSLKLIMDLCLSPAPTRAA
jgi:hypothetical protein